jgi:hypothetical protein
VAGDVDNDPRPAAAAAVAGSGPFVGGSGLGGGRQQAVVGDTVKRGTLSSLDHKAVTQAHYNGGESGIHQEAITMNNTQRLPKEGSIPLRWMTRLLSLTINSAFLLILYLAVTNEDQPQGPAIAVLVLLGLTMAGSFAAWRWEKAGGTAVIAGALGTGAAAYSASMEFGLGSQSFLPALLYGAPFLVLGILFWVCGHRKVADSAE